MTDEVIGRIHGHDDRTRPRFFGDQPQMNHIGITNQGNHAVTANAQNGPLVRGLHRPLQRSEGGFGKDPPAGLLFLRLHEFETQAGHPNPDQTRGSGIRPGPGYEAGVRADSSSRWVNNVNTGLGLVSQIYSWWKRPRTG